VNGFTAEDDPENHEWNNYFIENNISKKNPKTQLLLVDEKPNNPEKEDEFIAYKKPTIPDTKNGF
jgi:hypothetical protein